MQLPFIFRSVTRDTKHLTVQLHLPEGWTSDRSSVHLCLHPKNDNGRCRATAMVMVGERVEGKNTLYAFTSAEGRPSTVLLPIVILGR